ncbi:MAG: diguanylate cyclase [Amphritea sp.]|nr:diguanylate cyclase [Amphritea sp.]
MNLQLNQTKQFIYLTLFILYVGLAYLFSVFSPQAQIVSLWPPAGVALAGSLIFGRIFLPAIFVGSVIFNSGTQVWQQEDMDITMVLLSVAIASGSTIQAWVNYKVLRSRWINLLDAPSYSQVTIFILVAFLCCLISAVIGNAALAIADRGTIQGMPQWNNVLVWWVGDFLGVALVAPLLLSLFQNQPHKVNRITLVKGIGIPMILIVLAFQVSQQYIESMIVVNTKNEFELKAKAAENSLKQHMNAYIDALNQLEADLSQRSTINKEEFSKLVGRLTTALPGIKAMSWNPLVAQVDIPEFERYSRKYVDREFQIKGKPLLPTDPYVVVQLIEPLEKNRAAQGFNVFSNEARKQSMLRSKISQVATATDTIQLVQSDQKEPGFLIFAPVFKNVNSNDVSMGSYQSLSGFAVGVFLVSEIIQKSLDDELINFIDIYIYENGDQQHQVYGNKNIMGALSLGDGLSHVFDMKFANHLWTFNLHIDGEFVNALQVKNSLYFLVVEVLFGTLSAFIILSAFGRHEHLRLLVNARTSELEKVNSKLEHYAFYDSLTGLPNRRLFFDRAEHSLALAKRQKNRVALLFMDLNRFKQINDSLGHESGDQLLNEVAKRFSSTLRDSDTLARMGGDEFTLLIENNPSIEDVIAVAKKLAASLRQPIELAGQPLITSASIGVAIYPQDGDCIGDLLRRADTAMYQAKQSSVEICCYSEESHTQVS